MRFRMDLKFTNSLAPFSCTIVIIYLSIKPGLNWNITRTNKKPVARECGPPSRTAGGYQDWEDKGAYEKNCKAALIRMTHLLIKTPLQGGNWRRRARTLKVDTVESRFMSPRFVSFPSPKPNRNTAIFTTDFFPNRFSFSLEVRKIGNPLYMCPSSRTALIFPKKVGKEGGSLFRLSWDLC